MKIVGALLIIAAMIIGYISDKYISPHWLESFIALAFCFFLIGIYALILDNNCPEKGNMPKKCICNDIGKHTPGGRCEAEHSEIKRPEFPKDRVRTDKTSWEDRRY